MPKLLIVDDEMKIREVIKEYAVLSGYDVDEAANGVEAMIKALNNDYDCIVLDIMMPKLDGYSVCKKIREYKKTPIIMLSARDQEYDKLFGFELGVDDYVVKPFSCKELMARIKANIDRYGTTVKKIEEFEGLKIDFEGRSVIIDGNKALLTPKEIDLLLYLVKNKNIALSREKLLQDVWGYDYLGEERTVDTHIKMLRSSLGEYRKFIVTVRGMGYKFEI